MPRPIHDVADYQAALAALGPFWGREDDMNEDQTDWFQLVTSLVGDYEDAHKAKSRPKRLPLAKRLAGLIEIHGMTAADFGRLLDLEPSMGGKILKGTHQLTVSHIQNLTKHFGLPAEYFLEA